MAQNRNILVVDDEEDCRAVVQTVLQTNGFVVEGAASGQEALEKANPPLNEEYKQFMLDLSNFLVKRDY